MSENLVLAFLFGAGVFLMFTAFSFPTSWLKRITDRVDGSGAQLVIFGEANILRAILADLSRRIAPERKTLADTLRASGWVYASVAEYHFRRTVDAILFVVAALLLGIALNLFFDLPVLAVLILASLAAVVGFLQPDLMLQSALKQRRERLLREMGFGLERIALFLQSGDELSDALAHCQSLGLFGTAAVQLSMALKTRESISEAVMKVRQEVPVTPPFEEFLELVRSGQQNGQNLVEPFQTSARQMRALMQLDLIRTGNQAKTQIVLITSGVILVASLVVILGPMLLMLQDTGLF